mgnify:FL=1
MIDGVCGGDCVGGERGSGKCRLTVLEHFEQREAADVHLLRGIDSGSVGQRPCATATAHILQQTLQARIHDAPEEKVCSVRPSRRRRERRRH